MGYRGYWGCNKLAPLGTVDVDIVHKAVPWEELGEVQLELRETYSYVEQMRSQSKDGMLAGEVA